MKNKYLLAASGAYFMWGFFSFGSRPINNYPSLDIMCYRLYLCVTILSMISLLFRRKLVKADYAIIKNLTTEHKKKTIFHIVLASVILALNWLGFLYIVNEVNVQTAGLTYLICPILTTFLSVILLKEKLSKSKWTAIILSMVACGLLSIGHFKEMYLALLVALAFACYLIIQRKLNFLNSFNLLNIQTLIIAVLLTPIFINFKASIPIESKFYLYIGIIVLFFTIIPMFLNNYALKGINASTAGILIYINPLVNFVLAIIYYKETISPIQYAAYGLILLAIIIFNSRIIFDAKKLTT
jgi:chloramphenicol-sensitive protein RarD